MLLYRTREHMDNDIPFKIMKKHQKFRQTPHSHEYLQIWYVLKGSCRHVFRSRSYTYQRFGLFVIPPYTEHYIECESEDSELICCEFSERFINDALLGNERNGLFDFAYLEPFFLQENLSGTPFQLRSGAQAAVQELLLEMLEQFERKERYSYLFLKADLLKLLAILASEYESDQPEEKTILLGRYHTAMEQALAYLEEHYGEKLYLEDVCKTAMMSKSSFSYLFKQMTGATFSEYLMQLRIAKAQELLKNSALSVMEIAFTCGFRDSAYFTRAFRRATGTSPVQYRKISGLLS